MPKGLDADQQARYRARRLKAVRKLLERAVEHGEIDREAREELHPYRALHAITDALSIVFRIDQPPPMSTLDMLRKVLAIDGRTRYVAAVARVLDEYDADH